MLAFQNSAAALVPSAMATAAVAKPNQDGAAAAAGRKVADRLLSWSTLTGLTLGSLQFALLPLLVPLFSTLPQVQESIRGPALIASMIHVVNGPILAGEGIMIGMGCYKDLALVTFGWIGAMVACLQFTPLGQRLDGIMWSILFSSLVQQVGVLVHYFKLGPLAAKKKKG
jgi:Na+-driven multidrug efflux pump